MVKSALSLPIFCLSSSGDLDQIPHKDRGIMKHNGCDPVTAVQDQFGDEWFDSAMRQ